MSINIQGHGGVLMAHPLLDRLEILVLSDQHGRDTDTRRREALVVALYGAVWYRLLLDEPLDAGFISGTIELVR